jgi:hypothetical protein
MATKTVLIFGCGIAGLTTAHYLSQRGYKVTVVESNIGPGGSARSSKDPKSLMPTEYSWRGFGPWYNNTFSVMKEIPIPQTLDDENKTLPDEKKTSSLEKKTFSPDEKKTVYNSSLTKQISFHLLDSSKIDIPKNIKGFATIAWYFSQGITSDQRSKEVYSTINCAEMLNEKVDSNLAHNISQTFGPWIGSDSSRVSLNQVVKFFQRNLWPGTSPWYNLPNWILKGNSAWAFMNQPINEGWFDPWVAYLSNHCGVVFKFNSALLKLDYDSKHSITKALVEDVGDIGRNDLSTRREEEKIKSMTADHYVLCINPFTTKNILKKTPLLLAADKQLQMFEPLTNQYMGNGPHIQVAFQIGFDEKIQMPETPQPATLNGNSKSNANILVDSEYDITFCVQDQLWDKSVFLGKQVKSLWSGTACLSNCAGKLFGKTLPDLTYYEFIEEVKYQILKSVELNKIVQQYNDGRSLNTFSIIDFNVWKEWWGDDETDRQTPLQQLLDRFAKSATFLNDRDPRSHALKWVNGTNTEKYQPTSQTSISNLWLGGAHTVTSTNLYSMESAVESGRKVADLISNKQTVITQHPPTPLRVIQNIDNQLYRRGFPQVLQVLLFLLLFCAIVVCLFHQKSWARPKIVSSRLLLKKQRQN